MSAIAEARRVLFRLPREAGRYALLRPLLKAWRERAPMAHWGAWIGADAKPIATRDGLFSEIAAYPDWPRGRWARYRIRRAFSAPARVQPFDRVVDLAGEPQWALRAETAAFPASEAHWVEGSWEADGGGPAPRWDYGWPEPGALDRKEMETVLPPQPQALTVFCHADGAPPGWERTHAAPVLGRLAEQVGPLRVAVRGAPWFETAAPIEKAALPDEWGPAAVAAAMERAHLVITTDALGLACACAARRPTLALWRESQLERWRPLAPDWAVVLLGLTDWGALEPAELFRWSYAMLGRRPAAQPADPPPSPPARKSRRKAG